MRSPSIGSGLAALVLTAVVCVPGAQADPPADPGPSTTSSTPSAPTTSGVPSAADVRAARDRAAGAEGEVAAIQQRMAAAAAELDGATVRAAKATEAWNGARWAARRARATERRATADAAAADQALAVHKEAYREAVIAAQGMGLELSVVEAFVDADGIDSLLERSAADEHVQALFDQRRDAYVDASAAAASAADAATAATAEAERTLADARVARDRARAAAREAEAVTARIEGRRTRLVKRLARLQGVSVAVAGAYQAAVDAEAAAEAAAVKAAADAEAVKQDAKAAAPGPDPAPAPSDGAAAAIAFARGQLGEPYRWGAAGPNAWDCSGLVARAWAAGGTSLPHYSVAQYEQSTPITRDQLRPGDLVFWSDGGPGAIFHVALYVGEGRIIHAPRTGRPVTEESIDYWRSPDFFARP
ncbi:C40 family peptidase [Nocardioides daeguensis]|uniref:C40 family peptidase n=1 Tax=Nocardioides daeguensis TaxID=908359 RepID=UPI001C43BB54|nr:C40 family peptidase [Nocardioides daeguensis]MBV6728635.1 C40 family peptidase [Nocardioides daeguensis]MCR1773756.1 C40 family peptidase [Nocardioides daeguensis]